MGSGLIEGFITGVTGERTRDNMNPGGVEIIVSYQNLTKKIRFTNIYPNTVFELATNITKISGKDPYKSNESESPIFSWLWIY